MLLPSKNPYRRENFWTNFRSDWQILKKYYIIYIEIKKGIGSSRRRTMVGKEPDEALLDKVDAVPKNKDKIADFLREIGL